MLSFFIFSRFFLIPFFRRPFFILSECVWWPHQNQTSLWICLCVHSLYFHPETLFVSTQNLTGDEINQPQWETARDIHIKKALKPIAVDWLSHCPFSLIFPLAYVHCAKHRKISGHALNHKSETNEKALTYRFPHIQLSKVFSSSFIALSNDVAQFFFVVLIWLGKLYGKQTRWKENLFRMCSWLPFDDPIFIDVTHGKK